MMYADETLEMDPEADHREIAEMIAHHMVEFLDLDVFLMKGCNKL